MNNLFARVQSSFHHRQAEFLKIELETCSKSAKLASMMYQCGTRNSAERTIADAEQGYATILRFLSDPQYTKFLTIKATQEFTAKMKGLRKILDGLGQFKKGAVTLTLLRQHEKERYEYFIQSNTTSRTKLSAERIHKKRVGDVFHLHDPCQHEI